MGLGSLLASTAHGGPCGPGGPGPCLPDPEHQGRRGCTGKLIMTPPFKKGDIEKTTEDGFIFTAWIWANKKRDGYRTTEITVQGTCCWEIYNRLGESRKDLKPGQTITPNIAYIRKLKTKKCL